MADQLASPEDLAALVQSDLDLSTATVVIEACTAIVQEACGNQRLIRVVDDTLTVGGTPEAWLELPQRPVVSVASVTRDDGCVVALGAGINANYKVIGNKIWSRTGWQAGLGRGYYGSYGALYPFTQAGAYLGIHDWGQTPTVAVIVYTHGYADGSQDLQLARSAVLGIGRGVITNAAGVTSERIDDYSVAYEAAATRMEASPALRGALRRKYGRRAGLARIG